MGRLGEHHEMSRAAANQGMLKIASKHQEEEAKASHWPMGDHGPTVAILNSSIQKCETIHFVILSQLICGILLWQPEETNTVIYFLKIR